MQHGGNVEDVMGIINVFGQVDSNKNVADDEEQPSDFQGERLYDRKSTNADKWKVVIVYDNSNSEVARYGSGYYYLLKGTELIYKDENGTEDKIQLNGDYIINYEKCELIGLGERYKIWDKNSTLAVNDKIALNIDPLALADLATDEDYQKINITRHTGYYENGGVNAEWQYNEDGSVKYGVQYNKEKGALYFDGDKSYLELKKEGLDFRYGFTYEIYANLERLGYLPDTAVNPNWLGSGLFCRMPDLSYRVYKSMRFGYKGNTVCKFNVDSSWQGTGSTFKEKFFTASVGDVAAGNCGYDVNEDFYLTFVYTTYKDKNGNVISKEELKEKKVKTESGEEIDYGEIWKKENEKYELGEEQRSVDLLEYYINGKLYGYTFYGNDSYNSGCNTWNNDNCPFFIGACPWETDGNIYYLKGNVYTTRLYEKSLTGKEVTENRDATMQYRSSFMR